MRSRILLALMIIVVIAAGLASRKYPWLFPTVLDKYPGDSLWAIMVFLGFAFLWPKAKTLSLATLAIFFSLAIETSQLYQADWINNIRSTTLGHLVLGAAFSWTDILAYAVGIGIVSSIDAGINKAQRHRSPGFTDTGQSGTRHEL